MVALRIGNMITLRIRHMASLHFLFLFIMLCLAVETEEKIEEAKTLERKMLVEKKFRSIDKKLIFERILQQITDKSVLLKELAGETWKTGRKNREDAQDHSYASKMTEGKNNLDPMGTHAGNILGLKDARGTFKNLPWLGGKGVRIM